MRVTGYGVKSMIALALDKHTSSENPVNQSKNTAQKKNMETSGGEIDKNDQEKAIQVQLGNEDK